MTSQTSYNSAISYPNIGSAEIIEKNPSRVYYNNTSWKAINQVIRKAIRQRVDNASLLFIRLIIEE